MNGQQFLIAYLATLGALVLVFAIGIFAGALNDGVASKIEMFGMGAVTGGLIGLLRLPSLRGQVDPAVPPAGEHERTGQ